MFAIACRLETIGSRGSGACGRGREPPRMGEFSAEWLALRDPADHRARSVDLSRAVGARLIDRHPVRVVDLAAGAGSHPPHLPRLLPPPPHLRRRAPGTPPPSPFRLAAAPPGPTRAPPPAGAPAPGT